MSSKKSRNKAPGLESKKARKKAIGGQRNEAPSSRSSWWKPTGSHIHHGLQKVSVELCLIEMAGMGTFKQLFQLGLADRCQRLLSDVWAACVAPKPIRIERGYQVVLHKPGCGNLN